MASLDPHGNLARWRWHNACPGVPTSRKACSPGTSLEAWLPALSDSPTLTTRSASGLSYRTSASVPKALSGKPLTTSQCFAFPARHITNEQSSNKQKDYAFHLSTSARNRATRTDRRQTRVVCSTLVRRRCWRRASATYSRFTRPRSSLESARALPLANVLPLRELRSPLGKKEPVVRRTVVMGMISTTKERTAHPASCCRHLCHGCPLRPLPASVFDEGGGFWWEF